MKTERAAASGESCWAPTRSATSEGEERAGLEAHLEGCAELPRRGSTRWRRWRGCCPSPTRRGSSRRRSPRPSWASGSRRRSAANGSGPSSAGAGALRRLALGGAAAARRRRSWRSSSFGGGERGRPQQHVNFTDLPEGSRSARRSSRMPTAPRSTCTCRASARERSAGSACAAATARSYPAGTFRYRWGDDSDAVLSSALDLSRTRAIVVHAGDRTFVAPVGKPADGRNQLKPRRNRREQEDLRHARAAGVLACWRSPAAAAATEQRRRRRRQRRQRRHDSDKRGTEAAPPNAEEGSDGRLASPTSPTSAWCSSTPKASPSTTSTRTRAANSSCYGACARPGRRC